MPRLDPISAKKLMKVLKRVGFILIRTKGSHHFFTNKNGLTTVVPVHGNEDISVGLLKKILRDINISGEERDQLRRK